MASARCGASTLLSRIRHLRYLYLELQVIRSNLKKLTATMRLSAGAAISALCWSARLAAAQIYLYNGPDTNPTREELSPVPARMVLAQRAGAEDYHEADVGAEGVLEAINEYGRRTSLHEKGGERRPAINLLLRTDEDAEGELSRLHRASLQKLTCASASLTFLRASCRRLDIKPSSTLEQIAPLWEDLQAQARHSGMGTELFLEATSLSDLAALHETYARSSNDPMNIIIAPASAQDHKADTSVWGTYRMPDSQSPLKKRSAQRPQPSEEPLDLPPIFEEVSSEDFTPYASSNTTSAYLPGILPACFSTLSACQSSTNNCTSHGSCYKKYTDATAGDKSPHKECWTCGCKASVTKNSNGKTKTTYWGGPACQKKDVSTEFWMIALFSVGLVGLVGFAVGTVFGMGQEELPSVIGAGVSGPVRR